MPRQYKIKTFLRFQDEGLLKDFIKSKGITVALPEKKEKQSQGDYWWGFINTLSQDQIDSIERDFRDINEMAFEPGILSLLEIAKIQLVPLQKKLKTLKAITARHCIAL